MLIVATSSTRTAGTTERIIVTSWRVLLGFTRCTSTLPLTPIPGKSTVAAVEMR
jgi:hypothetical protein